MKREVTWVDMKTYLDSRKIPPEYLEFSNYYLIQVRDKASHIYTQIGKASPTPQGSPQEDFENNYKWVSKELILSEEVVAGRENYAEYVPSEGKKLYIIEFKAEAPYSLNSACKLIWDFGSENEEILWSTRGNGQMPFVKIIDSEKTDGIKKLAITTDNSETSNLLMAAYCKFIEV